MPVYICSNQACEGAINDWKNIGPDTCPICGLHMILCVVVDEETMKELKAAKRVIDILNRVIDQLDVADLIEGN